MSVVKLRGLPWSCTSEDVVRFLDGIQICQKEDNKPAIYLMTNSDGRPSGEAFIKVESQRDCEAACNKDKSLMGQRYIEVFRSNGEQLDKHLNESSNNSQNWRDPMVRLRGLPYGCEKKDILDFFSGLNCTEDGIMMVIDFGGRFNGEAFVQFGDIADALGAIDRHKQKISNRYIEVFRSTFSEMNYYEKNANNSDNGGGGNGRDGGRNGDRGGNNRNDNRNSNRNDRAKPYSRNGDNGNSYGGNRGNGNNDDNYGNNNNGRNSNNRGNYGNNNNNNNDNNYGNDNNYNGNSNNNYNDNNYNDNGNDDDDYNDDYNENDGHLVRMRGLPFQASENEIYKFFEPLTPLNVIILKGQDRRPTGEGEVDFATHGDALQAMEKHKKYMGKRYVELFLESQPGNDRPQPGTTNTPPQNLSLGSLMTKNFNNGQQDFTSNNLFTDFNANPAPPSTGSHPLMPPMPLLPPGGGPPADTSGSAYSTNVNTGLMAEMAQKMFASAYTHFQQTHAAAAATTATPVPPVGYPQPPLPAQQNPGAQ
jgi:heterogeneous nuclear ribonucleoprotein F/H